MQPRGPNVLPVPSYPVTETGGLRSRGSRGANYRYRDPRESRAILFIFPFSDGLITAVKAGVSAVIQPGGSLRDQEIIDTANALGISMVFTGIRNFRH